MAIGLTTTDESTGVTTTYWRLTRLSLDVLQRTAEITLHGYTSKAVRDRDDGKPVTSRTLRASGAEFDTFFGPKAKGSVYDQAYLYAQSTQSPAHAPRVQVEGDGPDGTVQTRLVPDPTPPFEGAKKA